MWSFITKILEKAANYGLVAFAGYEVGTSIDHSREIVKPKIILQTPTKSVENTVKIETILTLIGSLILVGQFFASLRELVKCAKNRNNSDIEQVFRCKTIIGRVF